MDMDHLIGQRFNLISKSEIRYFGTLHEINPDQSTIALEDVYSFGTEGREVPNFIPASQQKFDYIVFRGSDVKDIKIVEEQKENKQPEPQNVPNDPAILNSSRPDQHSSRQIPPPQHRGESPFPPPGYPPQSQFNGYYPPPHFGRGYGPPPPPPNFPPGPGFRNMPYGPPPPGYYGPPRHGFPPGPDQFHSPPQVPLAPPGQRPPGPPSQHTPSQAAQLPPPSATSELPVNDKGPTPMPDSSTTPIPTAKVPLPPVQKKSTPPASIPPTSQPQAPTSIAAAAKAPPPTTAPTQPSSAPKSNLVNPAVPFTVNQKSFVPPPSSNGPLTSSSAHTNLPPKPVPSAAAMEEASRQAKEAVAAAMAKLNSQGTQPKPAPAPTSVDNLAKKVGEMRTSDGHVRGGRGGMRGGPRGNFRGGFDQHTRRMEIPKSDYDFESANAKFNKEEMIKEAIATGSPLTETPESTTNGIDSTAAPTATNGEKRKDSLNKVPSSTEAYNKASSFFDNISSESKDREDERHQPRGKVFRTEEIKKNFETFGQGTVDGGGFRGRGRGGYRGRGRGYGGQQRGFANGRGGGYGGAVRGRGHTSDGVAQS